MDTKRRLVVKRAVTERFIISLSQHHMLEGFISAAYMPPQIMPRFMQKLYNGLSTHSVYSEQTGLLIIHSIFTKMNFSL